MNMSTTNRLRQMNIRQLQTCKTQLNAASLEAMATMFVLGGETIPTCNWRCTETRQKPCQEHGNHSPCRRTRCGRRSSEGMCDIPAPSQAHHGDEEAAGRLEAEAAMHGVVVVDDHDVAGLVVKGHGVLPLR